MQEKARNEKPGRKRSAATIAATSAAVMVYAIPSDALSALPDFSILILLQSFKRYMVMPLINFGKKSVDFCGRTSPPMAISATVSTLTGFSRKQI